MSYKEDSDIKIFSGSQADADEDFLRQIEISLGDLLNKYTGDIIDDNELAPNGLIAFFQKIVEFFQKIGDFFKNLFK